MSFWTIFAPAKARGEALGRIAELRRQMDEDHELIYLPINQLAKRVLPIIQAAEMEGKRLTKLYLPPHEMAVLEGVSIYRALKGMPHGVIGSRLLGLEVLPGEEVRVE